jgi:hypothetical protein
MYGAAAGRRTAVARGTNRVHRGQLLAALTSVWRRDPRGSGWWLACSARRKGSCEARRVLEHVQNIESFVYVIILSEYLQSRPLNHPPLNHPSSNVGILF